MQPSSHDEKANSTAKRERRKQARPGELLEAALDLFVEKGFSATKAEEVAARAGVSKGTLFLYFPSKEDLFKAVVRENIAGCISQWSQDFDQCDATASESLAHCYRVWWERIGATKASGITKLMMSEAQNFPEIAQFYEQEVIVPGHMLLRRILQKGMDSGEFKPAPLDHMVYVVLAPMLFLVMWKHSMGACNTASTCPTPEEFIALQTETILQGLRAR